MKFFILLNFFCILLLCLLGEATKAKAKKGEWTWIDGSQYKNRGNHLVKKKDDRFYPGARCCSTIWVDYDGNIWLFGGSGFDTDKGDASVLNSLVHYSCDVGVWEIFDRSKLQSIIPKSRSRAVSCGIHNKFIVIFGGLSEQHKALDDLWLYNIQEKNWTYVEQQANTSYPGARTKAAYWCYNGAMWIYGGQTTAGAALKDFWKLDLLTLKWTKMDIHGQQPGARYGSITWTDLDNFYLYGGYTGNDVELHRHLMRSLSSDLWMFSIKSQSWNKVKGSKGTEAATHGKIGTPDEKNTPGCLTDAASWIDYKNNLWLFGGSGCGNRYVDSSKAFYAPAKMLSNIWQFDIKSSLWIWHGNNTNKHGIGNYGEKGKSEVSNFPGVRSSAVAWNCNRTAVIFGGIGHDANGSDGYLNDLWVYGIEDTLITYNTSTEWTWSFSDLPVSTYKVFSILSVVALVIVFVIVLIKNRSYLMRRKERGRVRYTTLSAGDGDA